MTVRGLGGLVVAPQQLGAVAGAEALRAGGSAVDAAVAAAFALCVVDAANCGVGGYGGFLLYARPGETPVAVEFNTWLPGRFPAARLRIPGGTDAAEMAVGGAAVAPPGVVAGLLTAHRHFGRRPLDELLAPAIRLARDGFPVGRSLGWALAEHWQRTDGAVGDAGFRAIFSPAGRPLRQGETLVQADLAATLETVGRDGMDAFRRGRLVDAICAAVNADGGTLDPDDLAGDHVAVGAPETTAFGAATIFGPSRRGSGTGVLFPALGEIDTERLGSNRSRAYVHEIGRALAHAWDERLAAARSAQASPHTTHLCAADSDGGLVALTFTHGPWFGAGIVPAGTGIVLNGGANLFAPTSADGCAMTNMAPLVVDTAGGGRYALGGTGGPRIPGILLTAIVDLVHYGATLADALAAPHVSVSALDGRVELEDALLDVLDGEEPSAIAPPDFGPGYGITQLAGAYVEAVDPRFESGLERA